MEAHQKIILEWPPEQPVEAHESWIEAVSPGVLELALPLARGAFIPLPVGTRVLVTIPSRQNVQQFTTEIIGHRRYPVPRLEVQAPPSEQIEQLQRRQYFREPAHLPVRCQSTIWPAAEFLATTRNLSAGGLFMRVEPEERPGSLNSGDTLGLYLELPPTLLHLESHVIRVTSPASQGGVGSHWQPLDLAVEYLDIEERDQDRIIQFLFALQRELLRKGIKRS